MEPSGNRRLEGEAIGYHVIYAGNCQITTPTAVPLGGACEQTDLSTCFEVADVEPSRIPRLDGEAIRGPRDSHGELQEYDANCGPSRGRVRQGWSEQWAGVSNG